jgi:hypothetical protein
MHTKGYQNVKNGHSHLLKLVFADLVYTNCMRVDKYVIGPNYMICDSVEEYMCYEQHHSNVNAEDMNLEG